MPCFESRLADVAEVETFESPANFGFRPAKSSLVQAQWYEMAKLATLELKHPKLSWKRFLVTRCLNKYFQSQWQWLKFETFWDNWHVTDLLLDKLWQIDFKNIFVLRGAWTWVTNWPRRFQPIFETKLLGQNFWVLQNPIKRARPIWVGHNTLLHFVKLQQNSTKLSMHEHSTI